MINEIIMQNIKGQTVNQTLTGRDIICGMNGTGKTTRAQAVGISLLGYVPGGGKLPSETYKLCSDSDMTVGLQTDTFSFTRSFLRKTVTRNGADEVSIAQDMTVTPSRGEKTAKQKEARIIAEVGSLPVMLDFNEFLSLSDAKRREFFFNLAGIDSSAWSKRGVHDNMFRRLSPTAIEDKDVCTVLEDCIANVMNLYAAGDIQQSIQRMLDRSKEKYTFFREQKTNADAAARKIVEIKNELSVTDRYLEKNKEELSSLQAALMEASNAVAVLAEHEKVANQRSTRLTELTDLITAIETKIHNDLAENIDADSIRADIASYESDIRAVDHSGSIHDCTERIFTYRLDIERIQEGIKQYQQRAAESAANTAAFKRMLETVSANQGCCAIDNRIPCHNDFTAFMYDAEAEIAAANKSAAEENAKIVSFEDEIAHANTLIRKIEDQMGSLREEERAAARNNEDIRAIVTQMQARLADIAGRTGRLQTLQEEYNRLAASSLPYNADEMAAAITRKSDLETRITELVRLIDEQSKARVRLLDFKTSVIDAKEAEIHMDCWKRITQALGPAGIQGEIVKSILGPIQKDVQAKLTAMDMNHTFYFVTASDRGKEIFQLGWSESSVAGDECRRNFDALSTGEQMILLIALITTIIERSNPPLKILMIDNIENLDRENFRRVMAGLDVAAKNMDNVILLGVIDPDPFDFPDWTVWDLGKKAVLA